MSLELKKQNLETERRVCTQSAQVNLQADAMLSGAGRDSVEILMEDACAHITKAEVHGGRISVDGVVICQAAYRQGGSDIIRAVEARAQLQHIFEDESVHAGMRTEVNACVTHVESGCLNGRILFRLTVELHCDVLQTVSHEVICRIAGEDGIQEDRREIGSMRCAAEATAKVSLSETLALPKDLDTQATLLDFAVASVERAERDLGGVMVSGHVNVEVMITGKLSGKPVAMVRYPLPFSKLVEMPEWLTENVQAYASVDGIRSALVESSVPGEAGLEVNADITVRVCAVQKQRVEYIADAYSVGATDIAIEKQRLRLTQEVLHDTVETTFRGTLLIPEGMPAVSSVLAARARPSAVTAEGGNIEGILEIAVMYMPSDGEFPLTIRDELPFRVAGDAAKEGARVIGEVLSCDAVTLLDDRMEIRCGFRFCLTDRREIDVETVSSAREEPAEMQKHGVVMYWPGKTESIWDVGRRYRLPVDAVRREIGGETITPGKAVILKT